MGLTYEESLSEELFEGDLEELVKLNTELSVHRRSTEILIWKFWKNLETSVLEASKFIKNEIMTQVFSCEFCEISNNTFS